MAAKKKKQLYRVRVTQSLLRMGVAVVSATSEEEAGQIVLDDPDNITWRHEEEQALYLDSTVPVEE